mgnify:CR=1 FL=1
MTYRISIQTSNDAFQPAPGAELARILRALADRVEAGDVSEPIRLRDMAGNAVGHAWPEDDDSPPF